MPLSLNEWKLLKHNFYDHSKTGRVSYCIADFASWFVGEIKELNFIQIYQLLDAHKNSLVKFYITGKAS